MALKASALAHLRPVLQLLKAATYDTLISTYGVSWEKNSLSINSMFYKSASHTDLHRSLATLLRGSINVGFAAVIDKKNMYSHPLNIYIHPLSLDKVTIQQGHQILKCKCEAALYISVNVFQPLQMAV